jgi:branched-chain amino acid transport system permease protein
MNDRRSFLFSLLFLAAVFAVLVLFMRIEGIVPSIALLAGCGVAAFLLRKTRVFAQVRAGFSRRNQRGISAALLVLSLALPLFFLRNHYYIHIFTLSLIYVLSAVGLNMQVGSTNMVNFAQGAMFGVGAYTSALLSVNLGVSFWLSFPAAIVTTGIIGFLMGVPTLKTREFHLSLVTIAFAYIAFLLVLNMRWTGGADGVAGIPKPTIFGVQIFRALRLGSVRLPWFFFYYYLVLLFVILGIVFAGRIHRSWIGLGWNAIREDEISSKCYGMNIRHLKLMAFFIGSLYAGASGALYAHFAGFFSTEGMAFSVGLLMVCMVILGGMDNIAGVVLGTVLLVIIPEKFRAFEDFRLLFYGIILILMLLFRPQGLLPKRVRA